MTNKSTRKIKKINFELKKSHKPANEKYLTQIRTNYDKIKSNTDFKIACLNNTNQIINLYNENLNEICNIKHNGKDYEITDINFFRQNPNCIFDCTNKANINFWDLRNTRKEIIKIQDDVENLKYLTADINCTDQLLCVGTSYDANKQDSFVLMYDLRNTNSLIKKYKDAHSDDIVKIKFHETNEKRFTSASLDGLACVFDLNSLSLNDVEYSRHSESSKSSVDESNDEDDDLIDQVYNTDSSIHQIGYLNSDMLYAITLTNDLFIWDMSSQDQLFHIKCVNENENFKMFDYILGCFYINDTICVCFGTNSGHVKFYDISNDVYLTDDFITNGHVDVLRDSVMLFDLNLWFSVGEDGRLCKWSFNVDDYLNKKRHLDEDQTDVHVEIKFGNESFGGSSNWENFKKSKNK